MSCPVLVGNRLNSRFCRAPISRCFVKGPDELEKLLHMLFTIYLGKKGVVASGMQCVCVEYQ